MKQLILPALLQCLLLLFLIPKDKNEGEKELFRRQRWKAFDILIVLLVYHLAIFLYFHIYDTNYHIVKKFIGKNPYVLQLSLLIFIALYFKFKIKQSITSLGFAAIYLKRNILLGFIVASMALALFASIFFLLGRDPSSLRLVKALKEFSHPWHYVTFFLGTLVLLGPLMEEI